MHFISVLEFGGGPLASLFTWSSLPITLSLSSIGVWMEHVADYTCIFSALGMLLCVQCSMRRWMIVLTTCIWTGFKVRYTGAIPCGLLLACVPLRPPKLPGSCCPPYRTSSLLQLSSLATSTALFLCFVLPLKPTTRVAICLSRLSVCYSRHVVCQVIVTEVTVVSCSFFCCTLEVKAMNPLYICWLSYVSCPVKGGLHKRIIKIYDG